MSASYYLHNVGTQITRPLPAHYMSSQSNELWIRNSDTDKHEQHFRSVQEVVSSGHTTFQHYEIVKTPNFGKILYIDGEIQSSEKDEHIYHESFIHPSMALHPQPKHVLVIGAGEGATAREILKHPSVEKLVVVDIDQEVILNTQQHLVEWHRGALQDPKTKLVIQDGIQYVETTLDRFDVIFIDVCDNIEDTCAAALYSRDFYRKLKQILNPKGIVCVQAMELNPLALNRDNFLVWTELGECFRRRQMYGVFVPSFLKTWGFVLAYDEAEYDQTGRDSPFSITHTLQERGITEALIHYDAETHLHMFCLPKSIRSALQKNNIDV